MIQITLISVYGFMLYDIKYVNQVYSFITI